MEEEIKIASGDVKITTTKALDDLSKIVKDTASELAGVIVKRGAEVCSEVFDGYIEKTKKRIIERDNKDEQRNEDPDHS